MMDQYSALASYMTLVGGIGIVLCGLILFIVIFSIRPANRKKEYFYLVLIQSVFELSVGAWITMTRPLITYVESAMLIGILGLVAVFTVLFTRMYFINVMRSMFGK